MKPLVTLILFLSLISLSKGQDVPFDLDSMMQAMHNYEIIKLEEKYSFPNTRYYEGGVLVIPKEKSYVYDTIYVKNIDGIEKYKLNQFATQHFYKGYMDKRILAHHSVERCKIGTGIFHIRNEVLPRMWPNFFDYEIKEEYKEGFPNGLAEKMEIYSFKYDKPYLITYEEWKLIEKHKTNHKVFDEFVYEDNEGNKYYPFPSGFYVSFTDLTCNKIPTLKIQKALLEKGYDVEINGELNNQTKAALTKFQKDNGLPSCGGEHLWLEILGIEK